MHACTTINVIFWLRRDWKSHVLYNIIYNPHRPTTLQGDALTLLQRRLTGNWLCANTNNKYWFNRMNKLSFSQKSFLSLIFHPNWQVVLYLSFSTQIDKLFYTCHFPHKWQLDTHPKYRDVIWQPFDNSLHTCSIYYYFSCFLVVKFYLTTRYTT